MLKTRIITAIFLAVGLLATLFVLPATGTLTVFTLIVALAGWEWAGLLRFGALQRVAFALFMVLPCLALSLSGMPQTWLLGLCLIASLFWLLLVPLWFRQRWVLRTNLLGLLIGCLLLIPSWAAMAQLYARSPMYLLAAMALVWVADIAAYFAGRKYGRHKLALTISPGKTWEGAFGAVLGVLVYGLVLGLLTGHVTKMSAMQCIFAAAALFLFTALSIFGDLFESMIKRQAGLKDSSALLPGHGGILDRIDSLTSTLPFAGLALYWLA